MEEGLEEACGARLTADQTSKWETGSSWWQRAIIAGKISRRT